MLQSYIIYLNYQTIMDFFCDKKDREKFGGVEKNVYLCNRNKNRGA